MNTLWGKPNKIEKITRGFYYVITPGHGGYILSKALAEKHLPAKLLNHGFVGAFFNNYYHYEEDCAYAVLENYLINESVVLNPLQAPLIKYLRLTYPQLENGNDWLQHKRIILETSMHYYPDLMSSFLKDHFQVIAVNGAQRTPLK